MSLWECVMNSQYIIKKEKGIRERKTQNNDWPTSSAESMEESQTQWSH